MVFNSLKKNFINQSDIVRVAVGRGWKKAKVLRKDPDGTLMVKLKNGRTLSVDASQVMTNEEVKQFRQTGGATKIYRGETLQGNEPDDEESNQESQDEESPKRKKFLGLL